MTAQLRYVDPHRPRSRFSRAVARFSATRLGRWLSRTIAWKLDPLVLRATRSRFGLSFPIPTALLETRGAKTGAARRNAVIYFHDGDRVTIVARSSRRTRPTATTPPGPAGRSRSSSSRRASGRMNRSRRRREPTR